MSQSWTPFPRHGGKKRKPAANRTEKLESVHAQSKADRDALLARARSRTIDARVNLRVETETRIIKLRSAGIITPDIDRPATTLLRHHDPNVRNAAHALLSALNPRLRGRAGAATSQGGAR